MKQLDWKSFAIGVLLTTTVMFGTGSATSTKRSQKNPNEEWDSNQKWEVIYNGLRTGSTPQTTREAGYEPFQTLGNNILWRKRVK